MPDTLNATELRRWAAQCADRAQTLRCEEERERLRRMREAILTLAKDADWLAGASEKSASIPAT
jgi:hypothetical protein